MSAISIANLPSSTTNTTEEPLFEFAQSANLLPGADVANPDDTMAIYCECNCFPSGAKSAGGMWCQFAAVLDLAYLLPLPCIP